MSFMSNTTNKQPIEVGILEISSQNRAILEFFFDDAGKSYFHEVSLDKASAYIIDYDSLGAKESWKAIFEETKKPGIIISIKEVDLPSAIWLQKPLTVKALIEAGESIREMVLNEASPEQFITTIIEKTKEKEVVEEEIVEDIIEPQEELVAQEIIQEETPQFDELPTEGITDIPSTPIREMLLNEAMPEQVVTTFEEKTTEKEVIEEIAEDTIEPQEELVVQEIIQKETPQFDELPTEDIIDIPSEPISQVFSTEQVLEELESAPELQENKTEEVSQEETLEIDDSLITLSEKTTEEQTSKVDSLISEIEKPELAMADTKASASSSGFAASSNFVDIDLSLGDIDESLNEDTTQKSSTTPIDKPETAHSNEDDEIDSLLASLISGKRSNENIDKLINNVTNGSTEDVLDFDLETAEIETEEAGELPELSITNTQIIKDDGASLELESNDLEVPNAALSDESMATLKSLETAATIDDDEINKILHGGNKIEKTKKSAEEELQSLLEEIRQEAEGTTKVAAATAFGEKGNPQVVQKYAPENAEERWELTCGNDNIADLQKLCLFNPNNHILAPLIQNIQIAKQRKKVLRMKFNGIIVVIDPATDRIYCDQSISTEYYANICYEPMQKEKLKVHQLDESEVRLYHKKMNEDDQHTHYTEAFIWTSSLLTSRGRLPKNTNITNKVSLISWPNLTRVESFPHMMQIAALFHNNTWSLLEVTHQSDIQKNYVIAFYNAALSLDILQTDEDATNSALLDLKKGDNENRNFLSRFLKKLTV